MTRYPKPTDGYQRIANLRPRDDQRPLFVFDGHCGLCSGGVRLLMKADRKGRIAFASAQGELGSALYRYYGVEIDTTYLLIDQGQAYGMSEGYFRLLPYLGGAWRLLRILGLVPEGLRDAVYRIVARNRYRWFGRYEQCQLLTPEQRSRLL